MRKGTKEGILDKAAETAMYRRIAFESTGNGDETKVLRAILNELIALNNSMESVAERLDLMNKTLSLIHGERE